MHANISQGQLAELVGISQQHMSRIEQKRTKNIDAKLFAGVLNVSEEWIAFGKNPPEWMSYAVENGFNAESIEQVARAIQVMLDAFITTNPKLEDSCKLAVLQNAPVLVMAKALRIALIENVKTADELKKLISDF